MTQRLSVCMAIYNGAQFIEPQIRSILMQLGPQDELIAVDDGSWDTSEAIIRSFGDARIRYIRNPRNLGVVKTFERALAESTGDLIFFSDQDDIWADNKVQLTLETFTTTGAACILSDALLVDGDNVSLNQTFFEWRQSRPGLVQNWLRNSFMGCTMALRRDVAMLAVPFPSAIYMHDQWLGMLATVAGKVVFLPEPLIRYRRHGGNVTTMARSSASLMLQRRFTFAACFILRLPRALWFRLLPKNR